MHRLFVLALLACGATAAAPKPVRSTKPTPSSTNPCFPDRPPLDAHVLWKDLEKYSWSLYLSEDEPPPPPTRYGSCRVERNLVTAATGRQVAELGCGVRVLVPGIRDSLGLELGASGADVLARKPRPTPELTCMPNGSEQVRCRFDREPDRDTDSDWYVVGGRLDGDVLTGEAARAWFATRTLVELDVSIWCH